MRLHDQAAHLLIWPGRSVIFSLTREPRTLVFLLSISSNISELYFVIAKIRHYHIDNYNPRIRNSEKMLFPE